MTTPTDFDLTPLEKALKAGKTLMAISQSGETNEWLFHRTYWEITLTAGTPTPVLFHLRGQIDDGWVLVSLYRRFKSLEECFISLPLDPARFQVEGEEEQ